MALRPVISQYHLLSAARSAVCGRYVVQPCILRLPYYEQLVKINVVAQGVSLEVIVHEPDRTQPSLFLEAGGLHHVSN